ncbi:MAG: mechanosensitive ion channel domain-containing protein [Bacteroidota bacterium]
MLYFLDAPEGLKKIIPDPEVVKEKLAEKELKLNFYYGKFTDTILEYTPRVISAALVLLIGMWLIRRIARISDKTMTRRELDVSLKTFLKSLISIGLKIVLIVTVAGMIGVGTASFVTILGAAGLAVGLALQGSLSNFAGGVLILIFKPFKVGDAIEAGGQTGDVLEIQIFNTILLTADHKTVILPNGPLSNGTIVNNTRYGNLRIDLEFKISNDNDLSKVKLIIYNTLGKNNKVLAGEKTEVIIGKFSEGVLQVNVKPFCLPGNTAGLLSELYEEIKQAFEANGVKLAVVNSFKPIL